MIDADQGGVRDLGTKCGGQLSQRFVENEHRIKRGEVARHRGRPSQPDEARGWGYAPRDDETHDADAADEIDVKPPSHSPERTFEHARHRPGRSHDDDQQGREQGERELFGAEDQPPTSDDVGLRREFRHRAPRPRR